MRNVTPWKLSWRAMYIPRSFISIATSSMAPTPLQEKAFLCKTQAWQSRFNKQHIFFVWNLWSSPHTYKRRVWDSFFNGKPLLRPIIQNHTSQSENKGSKKFITEKVCMPFYYCWHLYIAPGCSLSNRNMKMTTADRFVCLILTAIWKWPQQWGWPDQWGSPVSGRNEQISEVHLCLQWETWPDQWGSPMSTMGDMTRSVRVTYVYNGRHDQISEGHLCLQWETWPDQWGSPMYNWETDFYRSSEAHQSTEGVKLWPDEWGSPLYRDRLTQAERFTCLEKETVWPKPWGLPVHTESQRLTQQTKCMVKLTSTDLFSTALMKSLNSLKGVPGPHRPNRVM